MLFYSCLPLCEHLMGKQVWFWTAEGAKSNTCESSWAGEEFTGFGVRFEGSAQLESVNGTDGWMGRVLAPCKCKNRDARFPSVCVCASNMTKYFQGSTSSNWAATWTLYHTLYSPYTTATCQWFHSSMNKKSLVLTVNVMGRRQDKLVPAMTYTKSGITLK